MKWQETFFEDLYSEPSRNGIYKAKEFHGSGLKIVNMGELFAYNFLNGQEMRRVQLKDSEIEKNQLNSGDLLFGRRSLVEAGAGKCTLVTDLNEPTTFESSIIRVRFNQVRSNSRFYYYWFSSPLGRGRIRAIVTGTNVKGIRGSVLRKIKVPTPPRALQNKIVDILSAYDDLIENNRRRIQLLEASARMLYREWFVYLRYPGHEHVKIVDGVPTGWKGMSVADIVEIDPKEYPEKGKEILYVPMAALSEVGMTIDLKKCEHRDVYTNAKFRNGDVLFARITPCLENGKTAFVNFLEDGEVACGSTEFIILRGRQVSPEFTYCLARTHDLREHARHSMVGSSGRQRVQVSAFSKYFLPLPPARLLEEFDEFAKNCFEQIALLTKQTDRLRQARDLLLPRLMNGEIKV